MGQLIIIVAMFALLWLFLIRPQRRRQLEQRELHESIEIGDEILTVGGLYGHVRELGEDDDLIVEIAAGTNVRVARRAVAGIVEVEEDEEAPGSNHDVGDPLADEPESAAIDANRS
jgi:preprotein translocase subunit YajC